MPPQRRQSLAPSTNISRHALGRKRAQSLVPDDANHQLAPRKSILKSTPFTFTADVGSSQLQENVPPSQASSQANFGSLDDNVTENTGLDYRAEISDNTTRKSLARRVSFAPLASFRIFESNDNTNSSGVPSSSPTPASPAEPESSPTSGPPLPPIRLSNENDYPGRRPNTAPYRRVSTMTDGGERSMSLDMDQGSDDFSEPPTDPVFFTEAANAGSDYGPPSTDFEEGTEDDEDDEEEDMEITEAIALNINRKRSLSIAEQHAAARRSSLSSLASRRRSSVKLTSEERRADEEEADGSRVEEDVTTNSQVSQGSEPMEFTIAVGEPLKEPKPPSEAWLALKAMTNGNSEGDDDEDGEEMELSNALSRLQQARSSLGYSGQDDDTNDSGINDGPVQEASFTSTESSVDESMDAGDRTMNVTSLMGRVSNLEISADESERDTGTLGDEDFARPIPVAPLNIQRKENVPAQARPPNVLSNSVFSAPDSSTIPSGPLPTTSITGLENSRSHTQRSQSPIANKNAVTPRQPLQLKSSLSSSVFSAPQPTPSRIPVFVSPSKSKGTPAASPTKKRPAPQHDPASDAPQPSPAKRRLLENSSVANQAPSSTNGIVLGLAGSRGAPSTTPSAPGESLGGMRRPAGYFAQRRSLAPGGMGTPVASRSPSPGAPDQQGLSGSRSPRPRDTDPGFSPSREPGQVQDENRNPVTASINDKAPASAPIISAPTVIITPTPDETQEGTESQMMDLEPDKMVVAVQRRSLVSSDAPPFSEEFDDVPSMSIKEFFLMTGVKFHEYTIPRRSTIHPSQLYGDRRDSTVPHSMADYLTAMVVHVPQLELYRLITKDLQTFIDNSMKIYQEAEEEVAKLTPILFREFAQANEEGREELLHHLKLIKANRLLAAKDRWYDVRNRWVQSLHENVNRGFVEVEKDRDNLSSIISQAHALLPALRQQHAQVQAQLERERMDIEEIENSDPVYLEELKGTIEEQNQLLEVYKTDVAEGSAKIERLEGKLAELEAQRLENAQAIEAAERRITLNKSSTRAEVFRLKDELECIQVLHSWRLSKISQQLVELVFNDQFLVSVPCTKYRPVVANITVARLDRSEEHRHAKRRLDQFPFLSELVVRQAEAFARSLSTNSIKKLVEALSDFWTSCAQIRKQFTFLGIKYPLALEPVFAQNGNEIADGVRAVVSILLPKHRAKVFVAFVFNSDLLGKWPFAIRKLQCEVKTAYGKINAEEVRSAVLERLSEATVEENHACLLDSCVEAASRFE